MHKKYQLEILDEKMVGADPFTLFDKWYNQAIEAKVSTPNAMTIATSSPTGIPSARIVLLKGFSELGFLFFTNYNSRKGQKISKNQHVALLFHWADLGRQIRIEGYAVKTGGEISDDYFNSRSYESRISAIVSEQSQPIPGREYLENLWNKKQLQLSGLKIERPANWGGYIVVPMRIEFWQFRQNRLHDRVLYTLEDEKWNISRLAP
jgi:pyridoxamine 5'-phosphate oxidase